MIPIQERCGAVVPFYGGAKPSATYAIWLCTFSSRFQTSQGPLCLRHLRSYVKQGKIAPDEYGLLCSAAGIDP